MFASWFKCSMVLCVVFAAGAASAEDGLEARLEAALAGTATPAVAAVVIRDGRIADAAAVGVRRNDAPERATTADVWLLGSTSKTMTVAAIARLVERGTLSWERPLSDMLPALADGMRPEYAQVTLVDLLSHRSGLPENLRDLRAIDAFFDDTRPLPAQRMAYIAMALRDAPASPPRTSFVYSNTGFLVAAVVAEQATGKPFEQILREEVFEPLGMRSAGFDATGAGQPQGHRGGHPMIERHTADDGVPPMFSPAGNMHMRLQDWATFCIDQLAGSRGEGRLLAPASYRLMQSAQPDSPSGLDWGVQASIAGRKGPVLVHGGSDGNWLAYVVLFPQSDSGVLVVANAAEDMGADRVTMAAMGGLFPSLAPPAAP